MILAYNHCWIAGQMTHPSSQSKYSQLVLSEPSGGALQSKRTHFDLLLSEPSAETFAFQNRYLPRQVAAAEFRSS